MTTVTLITQNAANAETLSAQDYRDIYAELRTKCSLRAFAEAIHSGVSFAWWQQYEKDETRTLDWARRNELRAAVGLPLLPTPPAVAVSERLANNAVVYEVGTGIADRAVLIGDGAGDNLTLRIEDNAVTVYDALVTPITGARTHRTDKGLRLSAQTYKRASAARLARRQTWSELVDDLLDLLDHAQ